MRQPHTRVTAGRGETAGTFATLDDAVLTAAGSTTNFSVSYETSLGQTGADLAQALLQTCERDFATLKQIFGDLTPADLPFNVQITRDASGASHASCMGTDISVGGESGAVDFIRSLLVAEEDEVFMANSGQGWDCGASPGEGLSRVLANDIYKNVEPAGFMSSNAWLNLDPRPNYVDRADPTDQNYESIGCSVLFLNWLRFQLGFAWDAIVAGGGATLAQTYQGVTGKATAWADFSAFMESRFPSGQQYALDNDNPFPA